LVDAESSLIQEHDARLEVQRPHVLQLQGQTCTLLNEVPGAISRVNLVLGVDLECGRVPDLRERQPDCLAHLEEPGRCLVAQQGVGDLDHVLLGSRLSEGYGGAGRRIAS